MDKKSLVAAEHPPYYDDVPPLYDTKYHNPNAARPSKFRLLKCLTTVFLILAFLCVAVGAYLIYQSYAILHEEQQRTQSSTDSPMLFSQAFKHWKIFSHLSRDERPVEVINIEEWERVVPEVTDAKCTISAADRIDCYPGGGSTQTNCEAKGCCWVPAADEVGDTPWCFFPQDTSKGYAVDEVHVTFTGYEVLASRSDKSNWPNDVMAIRMETLEETKTRFHFKISDQKSERFEVPVETPKVTKRALHTDYKVDIGRDPFGIKVSRVGPSGTALFDTTGTKLTFADQLIEITTSLPTNYIYGLGEHRNRLLHDVTKGFSMGTWARDIPPAGCVNCNLYGQHPFFIGMEDKTGTAYGVFLLNSNAMEISASPASESEPARLTYRTIGGILDFYVFTGPTPGDVVQQYLSVIGLPYMPPHWSLGYHLCRWGYHSSDKMKAVIKRMRDAKFPYDTQWNDIDYMENHFDWTYDSNKFAELPAIVKDLHDNDQHYIMIVDPGIANKTGYPVYDEGVANGVFIMHSDKDEPIIGKVWPGYTAYPDFFNPATKKWWLKFAQQYYANVRFDGLWTDMNEPSNFVQGSTEGCTSSSLDHPPYTPGIVGGSLIDKTICPSSRHHSGRHYDLHSMYGHSELMASQMALHELRPGKRTVVISRSTFPSSGKYAGHWTGDNDSSWDDLKYSIPGILNFQFFGIPFVGADICGFMGTTNGELCVRWTQLGVFYPFMRNHNTDGSPDQDPAADMFSADEKAAMMKALNLRYTLIPHLYTLLARAHMNGTMVAKPLWFEYSDDVTTYTNDRQFMWGESIMIAPVLDQGAKTVTAYFPKDTWYSLDYEVIKSNGEEKTIDAPMDKIPVYLRAGSIIPMTKSEVTTVKSRKNPFKLVVSLDDSQQACGSLYWDDGETLNATESGLYNMVYFAVKNGELSNIVDRSGYDGDMLLNSVVVINPDKPITKFQVNKSDVKVTKLSDVAFAAEFDSVDLTKPLTVTWM